jgi:hypothetical protein
MEPEPNFGLSETALADEVAGRQRRVVHVDEGPGPRLRQYRRRPLGGSNWIQRTTGPRPRLWAGSDRGRDQSTLETLGYRQHDADGSL